MNGGLMSWLVILFASAGAALILGALTLVSTLIGVLITAMIVLMCGPLIDRLMARRRRRSV
jgi:amino acid permease